VSLWRQFASGLLYAVVSVVLVVGGLSLALVEGGTQAPPAPPTATQTGTPTLVQPSATTSPAQLSPTVQFLPSVTTRIVFTATSRAAIVATATATLRPPATSTRQLFYPTAAACGPYSGWLKTYTVQPGDTLYHIATIYRTTVSALQSANCKPSTIIYPGDLLWVPNLPTITPGITVIPTFSTNTAVPTLTPEPLYYTETAVPTEETTVPTP
jgi:LysM repeat protein